MSGLSSELKRARLARGMNYGEAASVVGVHRTTFMTWETKGVPRNGTARRAVVDFIGASPVPDPDAADRVEAGHDA